MAARRDRGAELVEQIRGDHRVLAEPGRGPVARVAVHEDGQPSGVVRVEPAGEWTYAPAMVIGAKTVPAPASSSGAVKPVQRSTPTHCFSRTVEDPTPLPSHA